MTLARKAALVTGGGSGIGRAIALRLAREGASVAVADIDLERAQAVTTEVAAGGHKALALRVDVTIRPLVVRMVNEVVDAFGKVDILVNNAGIAQYKPLLELDDDDWERMFGVNVQGVFACTQEVAAAMIEMGGGGRIINLSSIAARVGGPGMAHYSATKAAVTSFTQVCAQEFGRYGITVNALAPGVIDTPMWDVIDGGMREVRARETGTAEPERAGFERAARGAVLGRKGEPEDVAALAAFLASDDASFITGQTINVDGGIRFN